MTVKEDLHPPAELSRKWSRYYLCEPHTYPFKLVVRGVERIIKNYSEHHLIVHSNCQRYDEEQKFKKSPLVK